MLHRLAAVLIILFWLAMTALLVRDELHPDDSRVRAVPLQHVLKLLYLHEQPSDLRIYADMQLLGYLHLRPRIDPETTLRQLEFNGTFQIRLGPSARQRFSWDGLLQLDQTYAFRQLDFGLTVHNPFPTRAEVAIRPDTQRAHVTLKERDQIFDERDYSLDEMGLRQLLEQLGADPAMFSAVISSQAAPRLEWRARRSSLQVQNQRVDTYLVVCEQGGQTLAEIHLSQLGHVLHARTLLGYTFVPDDVAP